MNDVAQQRNPVVLVHGIYDTGKVFHRMVPYLTQRGWNVYDLDLVPNNGNMGLDKLAQQVAKYINATFPPEQPINLVGFSMGGIVSRYYVQRLGGIDRVERFITISSPHHGTWVAYCSLGQGCIQMRPNNSFLQDLNQDVDMLKQVNFTSIWTPYDLMIVPANSSQMRVGRQVIVPVLTHAGMLTDIRSLAAVAEALSTPVSVDAERLVVRHRQFAHTQNFQISPLGNGNT
ncbi:esterase/lipase family protein [Iningainema tapete]|uniref:Triacylglycerol lipase n=1 Tax=Iningainema tapete BLCC-T55 TaxID=2748662 RepID=A0A8J6XHB4_9CYAN|nr:triacylglycerol lipase [Iningainema tapete]MBD2776840.1 triacylglycerol lipase [Iningainema tapete BLCC-T55]